MSPYVKVGHVKGGEAEWFEQVKKRVCKLQVGNPRKLVVIGKANGEQVQEKAIHRRFASARIKRGEWLLMEEGSAFTVWVESVRIDSLMFGLGSRPPKCVHCLVVGHRKPECSEWKLVLEQRSEAKRQKRATCQRCQGPNHVRQLCPAWKAKERAVKRERMHRAAVLSIGHMCQWCGRRGHVEMQCDRRPAGHCSWCRQPGHYRERCPGRVAASAASRSFRLSAREQRKSL